MSEFVKKTIMGYKAVSDGQSDSECTHVILTKEEYKQLLEEISTQKTYYTKHKNSSQPKDRRNKS